MGEISIDSGGDSQAKLERVVAVCERFEIAYRAGDRPRIEDFLEEVPEGEKPSLRCELELLIQSLARSPVLRPRDAGGEETPVETQDILPALRATRPNYSTSPVTPGARPSGPGGPDLFPADLGDYDLIDRIGRGGMGVVYRARQRGIDRIVALKVIRTDRLEEMTMDQADEALVRFQTESRAVGRLEHDHIVPIYEFGEVRGCYFYSMRYIEGQSVAEVLRGGPLPARRAAALIEPMARALAYAHGRSVVHRDLKPGNILVDGDDKPYVVDFGLAKLICEAQQLTKTQSILGSPPYMSPEQTRDPSRVGPAGDIYSLGATLYEMLGGRPPFHAADPIETLRQVREELPVALRQLNPAIPRDLETICLKCLEKEPARRYVSADALAADLRWFLDGEPIAARPITAAGRLARWANRRRLTAALLASLALVAASGFAGVTWQWRRAEARRHDLEVGAYFDHIALAAEAIAAERLARADQLLGECPESLRGWEWHYLQRRRHVRPRVLSSRPGTLYGVAFRPGRPSVVAAGRHGAVRVWCLDGPETATDLPGVPADVTVRDADWGRAPDGTERIVAACEDGAVRLWDKTPDGWTPRVLPGHRGAVTDVAFDASGTRIVSCGDDGTVLLCDAATGLILGSRRLSQAPIGGIAFSPDGRWIASCGDDRAVRLFDFESGEVRILGSHDDSIPTVAFSPDGRRLAAVDTEGSVVVREVDGGATVLKLEGHFDGVNSVAFSPDGSRIVTAGADGLVKLWDASTGREALTLRDHANQVEGLAFSRDGLAIASAGADGAVILWDASPLVELPALRPLTMPGHTGIVVTVAVSQDGATIASAGADGLLHLWDAATGRPIGTKVPRSAQVPPERINALAFDPAGRFLASAGRDQLIRIWDPAGGAERGALPGSTDRIIALAIGPGGRQVASGGRDQVVRVWDVAGRREARRFGPLDDEIFAVAFDPTGRYIASAGADRLIQLWDLSAADGSARRTLSGHGDQVNGLAFSPDGRSLASVSHDHTARIWDVASGRRSITLQGHASRVWGVAYSPDGRLLATAGGDQTVRLWSTSTGREWMILHGHTSRVYAVVFAADGRFLVSAGGDRTVRRWDAAAWGLPPATPSAP
jgi:eukaryotic-like serine/threonine-protein kinase